MQRTAATLVPLLGSCLLAAGCTTVGPDFAPPAAPSAQTGYADDGGQRATLAEGPEGMWWKAFGSPQLNAFVAQALAGNHSLAASRATLEKARQRIAAVAGKRLPQVDAQARAEYERVNLAAFGFDGFEGVNISNPEFDLYTVGGGISYDLDLFGKNRRALEQATAQAEAQTRATEAAHLVIAGRVVVQVLAIAAFNDRIETERKLLSEDERNVSLTKARQNAGAGTLVEVLSAQGQLAGDRASLPALEQQLAEGRAMLAVLLGISPAELEPTDFTLNDFVLPANVPVALPSALVHKRPDILEAEARLHASTAAVGVATAELYPDITLGASVTQSTSEPDRITSSKFNAFDIFAGVTAPIFHGGTLKANKRGAEAEARAAAAQYQQVVTEAFGQVSNLLSALDSDSRELSARHEAEQIADRSLHLSRRSFQVGNSGILQVLDASRSYQRAKLSLLEARTRQYQNVARLYVATAGGWIGELPQDSGS
ncbi:efflux transporter outer membrane subunit [Novosphingobium mangrovi (ex Huang et al. 2023)]|uniref:Efflux transporter outer membrane subunit n=1 Tax=Novosphingobium mangrovi (ex Huang et al. 2023) TaxID=2976432 RepID=A0ABT2I587_9SPHN|nr:efflux transporter outer membrane subunit [Novosphingobium mangrovi (ex Huang et al. 2023)]MCT2399964.1 efflux transporter outer membrane subunit [Novosphingobium mangrovi (ex Huang et al. 2023)]